MRHLLKISIIGLLLISCAPKMGKIHTMPELKGESSAEISIMRNYNFWGGGVRLYPTVNGKKVAGLYTNHHVQFQLHEGKYTFGLMVPDVVLGIWKEENNINKNIEANKQYYFLLSPGVMGMEIEEIDQKDAEKRLLSSNLVKTGSLSENLDPLGKVLMPIGSLMGLDEDDDKSVDEPQPHTN